MRNTKNFGLNFEFDVCAEISTVRVLGTSYNWDYNYIIIAQ